MKHVNRQQILEKYKETKPAKLLMEKLSEIEEKNLPQHNRKK